MSSCCSKTPPKKGFQFDPILHISSAIIIAALLLHVAPLNIPALDSFAHTIIEFLSKVWWGVAIGMIFVGIMNKVPREYFTALLGNPKSKAGIFKATLAGVCLDLCSHGILMVGAKLYERGASYAQIIAFLIASPWNSFSLTLILITLIGWKLTLLFIVASMVIALISGLIVQALTNAGKLPNNPNTVDIPQDFKIISAAKADLKTVQWNLALLRDILTGSKRELKILVKWLLLGIIIAAAIRSFVPQDFFQDWFGPTVMGLFLTLAATTVIEVCSEGSAPIASEIVNSASAPGNGFTFLMAGVSTDYTEIMILKDTTKSWKMAFILPIITVPQILLLGYVINLTF